MVWVLGEIAHAIVDIVFSLVYLEPFMLSFQDTSVEVGLAARLQRLVWYDVDTLPCPY
jgi:hypothetical protein